MKIFLKLFIAVSILITTGKAQIIVNGKSTYRPYFNNSKSALSISYGSMLWIDAKGKDLLGYSESLAPFHNEFLKSNRSKLHQNFSLKFGFEKGISNKFSVKTYLLTGKMYTGSFYRPDLIAREKSNVVQLSTYGNYVLSRPVAKIKAHLMAGPEFMTVNKNVIIFEYVEKEGDVPGDYNQKETIFEVGLTTGLGLSYDLSNHFTLFTEAMLGFSLPGGGFKFFNGSGLKYVF